MPLRINVFDSAIKYEPEVSPYVWSNLFQYDTCIKWFNDDIIEKAILWSGWGEFTLERSEFPIIVVSRIDDVRPSTVIVIFECASPEFGATAIFDFYGIKCDAW